MDRATDIYAFGALVFEVLTGQVPFDGDSSMDVLLKHMTVEPPRASQVCNEVPPSLDGPILHMLAKEASARPRAVGEALELLVASGKTAGVLVATDLPRPGEPLDALHAMATRPSEGGHIPENVVMGDGAVSPNGETFLASEEDVVPPRRARARLGAIAAVAVSGIAVGAAVVVTLGGHMAGPTVGAGLTPTPGTGIVVTTSAPSAPASVTTAASVATSELHAHSDMDAWTRGSRAELRNARTRGQQHLRQWCRRRE